MDHKREHRTPPLARVMGVGRQQHVIFLDYAKAFDTEPHLRLGNQIETFGISGNLLAWIMD